jgi:hypothetical protein
MTSSQSTTSTSPPPAVYDPSPLSNLTAIIADSANFSLERYIRMGEINSCLADPKYPNQQDQCACVLAGAKEHDACLQGFDAVRKQFSDSDDHSFAHLKWCVQSVPSGKSDDYKTSWVTGCINGIRK